MHFGLIDHYDSFTNNVVDWLSRGRPEVRISKVACDDRSAVRALVAAGLPLVLSPGRGRPGMDTEVLAAVGAVLGRVPILGICLGHQILCHLGGAAIVPGVNPVHGSARRIHILKPEGIFAGLQSGFRAGVYNSLVADPRTLGSSWEVTAECEAGEVAAVAYRGPGAAPAVGLQFHPESFLSERAGDLAANWHAMLAGWAEGAGRAAQASATPPLSMPS